MRQKLKPRGKPFVPGDPRAGRKPGSVNKATREIQQVARAFLNDPEGWAKLEEQYRAGTLNPAVIIRMFDYGYGKPKETIEHQVPMRPVVIDLLQPGEGQKPEDD